MTRPTARRTVTVLLVGMLVLVFARLVAHAPHRSTSSMAEGTEPEEAVSVPNIALPYAEQSGALEVAPPASDTLRIVAQLGGAATDVAARDGYAYVTQGSGLTVYDVHDPSSPHPVGRVAPLGGVPTGVALLDHVAYVATVETDPRQAGHAGLAVVDVVDPTRPVQVARLVYPGGLQDVVAANGYAYVIPTFGYLHPAPGASNLMRVIDLGRPTQPREVGRVELSLSYLRLAVEGNRVYTAGDVVDVSDPLHPTVLEPFAPDVRSAVPSDLAPAGDVVGFTASGLDSWNNEAYYRQTVAGPISASVTAVNCPPEHESLGIARDGDWFITAGREGGCVFNAPADGSAPSVHGYAAPGRGMAVAVDGAVGYVAIIPEMSDQHRPGASSMAAGCRSSTWRSRRARASWPPRRGHRLGYRRRWAPGSDSISGKASMARPMGFG